MAIIVMYKKKEIDHLIQFLKKVELDSIIIKQIMAILNSSFLESIKFHLNELKFYLVDHLLLMTLKEFHNSK